MSVSVGKLNQVGAEPEADLKAPAASLSVAKTVDIILEYAIKSRATDIHIEPRANLIEIRFRIDGSLHEMMTLPKAALPEMALHIKMLASLKRNEHQLPQDGRFTFKTGRRTVTLRVSTLPVIDGEKLVLRLLDQSGHTPTLAELGVESGAAKRIIKGIHQPHGLVLVAGPTGAGKSTTLFSLLGLLNSPGANIATIDDTIEHHIDGATQTQLNLTAGLTFASGLRALLRQDPNIIMVGELRNSATANLAVQAAQTNRLILSTLPAASAAAALSHLRDLKVEPLLIASTVTVVVAQRLVRRLCSDCRIAYPADSQAAQTLKQAFGGNDGLRRLHPGELTLYRAGAGCKRCSKTGYQGRIGIYEVLEVNPRLQEAILNHATTEAVQRQAAEAGMLTLQQDGFLKALQGLTTIEEVVGATQVQHRQNLT